jgi:hypothetical protein
VTDCATCQSWSLKASPLARAGMAPCAFGNRWEYLPPTGTCAKHKPVEQAAADARVLYLGRLDQKHKGVTA